MWNVDSVDQDGQRIRNLTEAVEEGRTAVGGGISAIQYDPLPAHPSFKIVNRDCESDFETVRRNSERVGWRWEGRTQQGRFFDGGSQGNPRPGGSGSVQVELDA